MWGKGGLNLCRFYNIFEHFLQSTPKILEKSTPTYESLYLRSTLFKIALKITVLLIGPLKGHSFDQKWCQNVKL